MTSHDQNLVDIERARAIATARKIIDDVDHPSHNELMAIIDLEVSIARYASIDTSRHVSKNNQPHGFPQG